MTAIETPVVPLHAKATAAFDAVVRQVRADSGAWDLLPRPRHAQMGSQS
jgi:hypothetical protein